MTSAAAAAAATAGPRLSAQQIKQLGKPAAAAYLANDLASVSASNARAAALGVDCTDPDVSTRQPQLDEFMHFILNPDRKIDDKESIEWCMWLIGGGRTPTEFAAIGECFVALFFLLHRIYGLLLGNIDDLNKTTRFYRNVLNYIESSYSYRD